MNTPNDFAFQRDGEQVRLLTPGYDINGLPYPSNHDLDRPTAERLLAELSACLGVSDDLLDDLERMAREHCHTEKERTYHGMLEFNVTDSGGITANAEALRKLARHGRFRIIREYMRMVVGYWPENDPTKPQTGLPVPVADNPPTKGIP